MQHTLSYDKKQEDWTLKNTPENKKSETVRWNILTLNFELQFYKMKTNESDQK